MNLQLQPAYMRTSTELKSSAPKTHKKSVQLRIPHNQLIKSPLIKTAQLDIIPTPLR